MGNATKRAFDATQNNRYIFISFFAPLGINNGRAIGTLAADITSCISVIAAHFAIRRIPVDHRVHIARGHAKKQIRLTKGFEGFGALPVGLGNDTHPKSLIFKHSANHGHAKARMIHVRITRDNNDVTTIPAKLRHLLAAHRQERRHAKARGPELAIAAQGLSIAGKKGNVGVGSHIPTIIRVITLINKVRLKTYRVFKLKSALL